MQLVAWLIVVSSYIANLKAMTYRRLSEWFMRLSVFFNADIDKKIKLPDTTEPFVEINDYFKQLKDKKVVNAVLEAIQEVYPGVVSMEDFWRWTTMNSDGRIRLDELATMLAAVINKMQELA
jgi:hypothetical protein